jgi:hydrophobe/amphiphile efflux-1 (HAE1) family protein
MNISGRFIVRPIATSLLMLGIFFLGIVGYILIPIAGVPQVDIPTIQVQASLPGASAETMATTVAAPLERQLALIPGLDSMSSTSSLGATSITIQFDLARDVDGAAFDVQSAINAAAGDLPKNLPHPPTLQKANPADALLMTVAVTSDALPIAKVDEYAETVLALELARIAGVGVIDYHGQQKPAVRVQVNPAALAALGISLEDVRAVLSQATANLPKGTLNGAQQAATIDATDQLVAAREYADIIVAYRNGSAVRLKDVASVIDGAEDSRSAAWIGDHRQAVLVDVHKQPGHNINRTVARIQAELPRIQQALPPSLKLTLLQDRTQTIKASVADLQFTLTVSVLLVLLTVFLFVRNARATLIPSVAIPLSLVGTIAAMQLIGYTLDNVSLMALTVTVGFVIDDAIVMLENILRHMELGESPLDAALKGASEIGFTIMSMTISLIAVFIPLLFMGGLVGRLFREFAVTAAIAIILSGIISLTLTPMMCARFLRPHAHAHPGPFERFLERAFDRLQRAYESSLRWVLARQRLALVVMLATMAGTVALYTYIPKGFFPRQDNGLIVGVTEAAQDISFEAMSQQMHQLAKLVTRDPDVAHVYYNVEGRPSTNIGRFSIDLKPFGQRTSSVDDVIRRLRPIAAALPGISLYMQARQDVTIGARVSKTQYQYTLHDADVAELNQWASVLLKAFRTLPQLQDVAGDLQPSSPQIKVVLDRDALSRVGIAPEVVDETLYDAFGQRQVATFYTELSQYRVVLEVDPRFQLDDNALKQLYIRAGSAGSQVPLASVAHLQTGVAPLTINRDGQLPAVTLSFNLAPGYSLGDAVAAIDAKELALNKPVTLGATFQGTAQVFQSSLATQPYLIAAAIIAIYIVLGVLYESYIHPITILSTLPSAGIGALAALLLFGYEFSLIALIGIILLIGIVKKNGIMMVDFAITAEQEQGMSPEAAIYKACAMRFRPIMMTTMAALLGALPLALGTGAGSELRRPLGITMVGGLIVSQLLTLYTTPVIYVYVDRLNSWVKRLRARPVAAAQAGPTIRAPQ